MKQVKHKHRRETTFPGIVGHALKLKVSRPHLWLVLTGQRPDASDLIPRYKKLLRAEGRHIPIDLERRAA